MIDLQRQLVEVHAETKGPIEPIGVPQVDYTPRCSTPSPPLG
jgi:hypothetical protein